MSDLSRKMTCWVVEFEGGVGRGMKRGLLGGRLELEGGLRRRWGGGMKGVAMGGCMKGGLEADVGGCGSEVSVVSLKEAGGGS